MRAFTDNGTPPLMVFMDVGSNSTPVSFYRYNLVWVRRDGLRLAQRPDRPSDTVALLR